MFKINSHPILVVPEVKEVEFTFNGKKVKGEKGYTIAAALHQSGFPVHSHSLKNRNRSLECGIGKCGACEMLVNGEIRRIKISMNLRSRRFSEIVNSCKPPPAPLIMPTEISKI